MKRLWLRARLARIVGSTTSPQVIRTNKIKVLLCVHPAFTFGAFHSGTSLLSQYYLDQISLKVGEFQILHKVCQPRKNLQ